MEAVAMPLLMSAFGKLTTELYTIISLKKHNPELVKDIEEFTQSLEDDLLLVKKKLATLQDDQFRIWAIESVKKNLDETRAYLEQCRTQGFFQGCWNAKKTRNELTKLRVKLSDTIHRKLICTTLEVLIDKDKRTNEFYSKLEEKLDRSAELVTRSDIDRLTNEIKGLLKPLIVTPEDNEQRFQHGFQQIRDEMRALSSPSESGNCGSLETEKFLQDILLCLAEQPVPSRSFPTNEEESKETQYCDPFTYELMYDPVKCGDGKTYDRFSVFKHNAAINDRPLDILCPDESLRVRLFDKFQSPDPYKILRSRRDQYRAEALAIADADDFGEALVRLDNVLQWDPIDSECLRKRDRLREIYRKEAINRTENGSSKEALAMLQMVQSWSPGDREVFDKIEMINRQSSTTTESGYHSGSNVHKGTVKSSVQPARESLPGTFSEDVQYATQMGVSDERKEEKVEGHLADEERERGNLFYKKGSYHGAIKHYTEALKYNPKDAKAYSNRAACYTKLKDFSKALEDANNCIDVDPKFTKGYSRKGEAYFSMGKYNEANDAYLTGLTYEKDNKALLEGHEECERAKSYSERQAKLEECFKGNLALANKERESGNLFYERGSYHGAIKHYTEALKYNPKDAKAYSNRAACYTKLKAFSKALEDANNCIDVDPKFTKGYCRKGEAYFLTWQYDEAIDAYLTGLTYEKDSKALLDGIKSCEREKAKERGFIQYLR